MGQLLDPVTLPAWAFLVALALAGIAGAVVGSDRARAFRDQARAWRQAWCDAAAETRAVERMLNHVLGAAVRARPMTPTDMYNQDTDHTMFASPTPDGPGGLEAAAR
jgi:hypothetical protein